MGVREAGSRAVAETVALLRLATGTIPSHLALQQRWSGSCHDECPSTSTIPFIYIYQMKQLPSACLSPEHCRSRFRLTVPMSYHLQISPSSLLPRHLLLPTISGLSTEIKGDVSVLDHMPKNQQCQYFPARALSGQLTVSAVASSNRTG